MSNYYRKAIGTDGGGEIVVQKRSNETSTRAILRGIAALKGIDELELERLFESIEPGSLNRLMEHSRKHDCAVSAEFYYEGCAVRLGDEGEIRIAESPQLPSSG